MTSNGIPCNKYSRVPPIYNPHPFIFPRPALFIILLTCFQSSDLVNGLALLQCFHVKTWRWAFSSGLLTVKWLSMASLGSVASSAAAVWSRTTVLMSARTRLESGSGFWVFPNGLVLVWPFWTFLNWTSTSTTTTTMMVAMLTSKYHLRDLHYQLIRLLLAFLKVSTNQ